jgi:Ankyrin repeats (3 copies)
MAGFFAERRCSIGVIEGPDEVSWETMKALERQLAARNRGLWLGTTVSGGYNFAENDVLVQVFIPDGDPFEPTRLRRIFDVVEAVIVAHMPRDIPILDDDESWVIYIETEGDRAMIDSVQGGREHPWRNERGSDHVGAGARWPATRSAVWDEWNPDDPLWDYLADRPALETLLAEGERIAVSVPIFASAVETGDVALVRLLLKEGGDWLLDAFDPDLSWTPLMRAVKSGDLAMMTFLIDAGSDVNANEEAKAGDTALMVAVQGRNYGAAKLLVEHGADPTIRGWMRRTALDHAADHKRMPELYALLKAAADGRLPR